MLYTNNCLMKPREWACMCGEPKFWLYGFRGAANAWECFYLEELEGFRMERGPGRGVVFYHKGKDLCGAWR